MGKSSTTTGDVASKEETTPHLLASTARFFREHPAMLGSLLYLLITSMGMIYSFALYNSFGINVFDFAEINDLLLAAFKDLAAFLMSVFTITLTIISLTYWSARFEKRRRERSSANDRTFSSIAPRRNLAMVLAMAFISLFYAFIPPYIFAEGEARSIKNNSEDPVTVTYRLTTSTSVQPTTESGVELIGATEKAAFFYDPDPKRTLAVPHAQIISIEFPG